MNVKTDRPRRFKLEGETARLIDEYLADWRPRLCSKPNPWLFSNSDGGVMAPRSMALSIQRQSRRIIGCAISPHQFRHIPADSFLQIGRASWRERGCQYWLVSVVAV